MQPLTMGDLCEIVGTDRKVADFVKQMPVTGLQPQKTGRSVISVLMLVEVITVQVQKQFAGIQCQCVLLGAEQLIVEWGGKKAAPWWVTILKTVCVSLIILAGSAFTIMTYDQDVDVAGVFVCVFRQCCQPDRSSPDRKQVSAARAVSRIVRHRTESGFLPLLSVGTVV